MTPDICVQAGVDFEMVSSQQAVMRIRKFPGGHGSVAFAGKSMGGGGWMIDYVLARVAFTCATFDFFKD